MMKAILSAASIAFGVLAATAWAGATRPVVVELFTSQGCSSCPPADALLGELAKRRDVVALGFHVTYWDGAAWRDPLSRRESTERQQAYDDHLTRGQLYTPQMVIDGTADVVGSDRSLVLAAIDRARPVVATSVTFAADGRSVTIGAGTAPAGAGVLLVRYALKRSTQVKGGENAGRGAVDVNAVTSLKMIGDWTGKAASFAIDPPADGEGIAVLVQAPDGHYLGAASAEGLPASLPSAPKA
ncbi:MAG TPA: DUF1223 domain-containing protein [Stellaceae bacterium]|nr:DUF1223 domain-containing protein [Stellaceae bacterium]